MRHQVPVFPIVLYLRGGPDSAIEDYREELFGQEQLRFRFRSVALARLAAEEYVGTSPLGAALAALMRRGPTRARLELRREMLFRVLESALDEMKGRAAGIIEGKRETLLRLLAARFGPLTDDVKARIAAAGSASELDAYLDRFVTASSLEELGLGR
jgi:hypothetical protein